MGDLPVEAAQWLSAAQAGSREALGQILEACRGYLLLIARQELEPAFQAKGGASDLVQQTFLEAQRDFDCFHGTTANALLAWMRQLLRNNLANFRRDFRRDKRRLEREVSLDGESSTTQRIGAIVADLPSPSGAIMRDEQFEALARALELLPEDHRRVIELRYCDEQSFKTIAAMMQRSENAVRKLWARAIERLQQEMELPR